jgi:hypothetical protein
MKPSVPTAKVPSAIQKRTRIERGDAAAAIVVLLITTFVSFECIVLPDHPDEIIASYELISSICGAPEALQGGY